MGKQSVPSCPNCREVPYLYSRLNIGTELVGEGISATGLNKDACCGTPRMIPITCPLYRPRNPSSLASLARETCPPNTPPNTPPLSPLLLHSPFATLSTPKLPISRLFWSLYALIWVQNAPLAQETCRPALLLHPITCHPSTRISCGPSCVALLVPKLPISRLFLSLDGLMWVQDG